MKKILVKSISDVGRCDACHVNKVFGAESTCARCMPFINQGFTMAFAGTSKLSLSIKFFEQYLVYQDTHNSLFYQALTFVIINVVWFAVISYFIIEYGGQKDIDIFLMSSMMFIFSTFFAGMKYDENF